MSDEFLNPYTFIPAFPRARLRKPLTDDKPPCRNFLRSAAWTGRIGVILTVETPLLLLDTAAHRPPKNGDQEHKVYPVRLRDGRPYLSATSVKGMLRAAYEAITNSRFGVFEPPSERIKAQVIPEKLLPRDLHPARTYDALSPADRLFGWIAPNGEGTGPTAYRGRLRIGPVTCDDDASTAVRRFSGDGLPLAILSTPKPKQGRFYLSESVKHPDQPIKSGTPKANVYQSGRGLRGRKVYWHHAGLEAARYWNPDDSEVDPSQVLVGGRYREYVRPWASIRERENVVIGGKRYATDRRKEQRDKQNRSIEGWIKPGTTFRFQIEIRDADEYELGALAWLLTWKERRFHRIGLGRPLGFGSVRLEIDPTATELHSGDDYRAYYRSLAAELPRTDGMAILRGAQKKFEKIVESSRELKIVVATMLAVAKGSKLPVHYPRTRPSRFARDVAVPPGPRGENFKWFRENERLGDPDGGRRRSLPGVLRDNSPLKVYPEGRKRSAGRGGPRQDSSRSGSAGRNRGVGGSDGAP